MFKNLSLFAHKEPLPPFPLMTVEMQENAFQPTRPHQKESAGWVPAIGNDMVYHTNGATLLRYRKQTRIPQPHAVASLLSDAVGEQSYNKKEIAAIKAQIIEDMMPEVYPKDVYIDICCDATKRIVYIDTASEKVAQDILALMRITFEDFAPLVVPSRSQAYLRELAESKPDDFFTTGFTPTYEAVFLDADGGKVTYHHSDFQDTLDGNLLSIDQLGLEWKDEATFKLCESGDIRSLKFLKHKLNGKERDADFVLVVGNVRDILDDLA